MNILEMEKLNMSLEQKIVSTRQAAGVSRGHIIQIQVMMKS